MAPGPWTELRWVRAWPPEQPRELELLRVPLLALPTKPSRQGRHTRSARLYGRCRRQTCLVLWSTFRPCRVLLHLQVLRREPAQRRFAT
jgi:hypothetical protein